MARRLAPGDVIGGFRLEQKFHHGGMGTLWKVSRADIAAPLVMKLPFLLPGEDPLTIVSYETERMIMPRLSGSHVPAFIAAGDFERFIDDDGEWGALEAEHFGCGEAQDVAVDARHALNAPLDQVFGD